MSYDPFARDEQDPSVFKYLDFRIYLRDVQKGRKDLTWAIVAQKLDTTPGNISMILRKEDPRSLTPPMAWGFAKDILHLNADEREYFFLLIQAEQGATVPERRRAVERVQAIRRFRDGVPVLADHYDFFSDWRNAAVFELARCQGFTPDAAWIADHLSPPAPRKEVEAILQWLLRLGALKEDEGGRLVQSAFTLKDDERLPATVRGLPTYVGHQQALKLAQQSLDQHSDQERMFRSCTIAVDAAAMAELRKRIVEWVQDADLLSGKVTDPDRVILLEICLFPVSEPVTK